jgi:hypothetical protein
MRKFYLVPLLACLSTNLFAQAKLTTKNNVRIWEHHSSAVNGGKAFGTSANGRMSGYDFIKNTYFSSIDTVMMDKWPGTEYMNIDLVEHNGPYGNTPSPFGFTSAASTIWGGDIRGNGKTMYMEAPVGFNYDSATSVATIRAAFDSTKATASIAAVANGKVYLARVRKSTRYIAMKITNVKNVGTVGPTDTASVYFDFSYKYGDFFPTSVDEVSGTNASVSVYPNPTQGNFTIELNAVQATDAAINVYNHIGQIVSTNNSVRIAEGKNSIPLELTNVPAGMYYISVQGEEINATTSIVKE